MIDKVALIYLKDRHVLMSKSKGKDKYYLPGGKREGNESDSEVLKREILEELSAEVIDDTIRYYGTFSAQAHGKNEGVIVQMTCYNCEVKGQFKPDNEIEEICWFTTEQIDKISDVDKLIYKDLKEKGLLD